MIAKSTLALSVARLAAKGLAFLAAVLVALHLGRDQYGEYSLILAFALIFSYLADFGVVSLLIREVAARPERVEMLLVDALSGQACLSVATVVTLVVAGFALETSETVRVGILLAGLGLLLESLGRPFSAVLIGQNRVSLSAVAIAAISVLNTALLLAMLILPAGVLSLVAVSIPVGAVSCVLPAVLVLRHQKSAIRRLHVRLSSRSLTLLRQAVPFAILAGAGILYDRLDVVVLAHISGDGAVGVYAAADRIIDGLLVVPASAGATLYPVLSAAPYGGMKAVRATWRWLLPAGGLLTAICAGPGTTVVGMLYGVRYAGVGSALSLLSGTVLLQCLSTPLAYLLQARSRTGLAVLATAGGLAVDLILDLLLIPELSYRGAAISALVADAALLACLAMLCRRSQPAVQATLTEAAPVA